MNWDEFDKEIRELGRTIDWKPDVVIGIARGGLVPARLLSSGLNVYEGRAGRPSNCATYRHSAEATT